jgi:hypothetical protein
MLAQYIGIKLKHSEEPENRKFIAETFTFKRFTKMALMSDGVHFVEW